MDPVPDDPGVHFRGAGLGHGLGMSQYGARGAGLLGCSATTILETYYRGASVVRGSIPSTIRVWMLQAGTSATVTVDADPTRAARVVWRTGGTDRGVQREGQTWVVRMSGSRLELVDHRGARRYAGGVSKPLKLLHSGTTTTLRTYRGSSFVLERRNRWDHTRFEAGAGVLDVQQWFVDRADNGTAMDKYLYGLAEVSSSWPAETLKAQAIAGRTFATKNQRPLYPSTSDQYYGGYDPARAEPSSPWRQAVDATTGRVLTNSSGQVIDALYSASMAGWTEDRRYVWGGTYVFPHLTAVDDSAWANASADPYRTWTRSFSLAEVAAAFGFDRVTDVEVAARGSAARHAGVAIRGVDNGATTTRRYTGWDVRTRLGLPSPGFVVSVR